MGTTLRTIDQYTREFLEGMVQGIFLDGECYAFAIALSRGLGWPIIGIMQGDVVRHAVVQSINQTYYDARGKVSYQELGTPFQLYEPAIRLQEVDEDLLQSIRPVHEHSIHKASRLAEVLWPELPWKDSFRSRITVFASELEALSRKHELWIRSSCAIWPMISIEDGNESGYRLRITDDGGAYMIDRSFE